LGSDPQEAVVGSGARKVTVSLATDTPGKDVPTWHHVTAWNGVAEQLLAQRKGHKVAVEGRLHKYAWDDKNGNPRHEVEVVAGSVRAAAKDEASANLIVVLGHTARDARYAVPKGHDPMTGLLVVTNRNFKLRSGEWADPPERTFHDVVARGALADALKGVSKGTAVGIEGALHYRKLPATDKRPERTVCEILASRATPVEAVAEDRREGPESTSHGKLPPTGTDGDDW
jgi:single-stranded DNA-binding protein